MKFFSTLSLFVFVYLFLAVQTLPFVADLGLANAKKKGDAFSEFEESGNDSKASSSSRKNLKNSNSGKKRGTSSSGGDEFSDFENSNTDKMKNEDISIMDKPLYEYVTAYRNEISASYSESRISTISSTLNARLTFDYKRMIARAFQLGFSLDIKYQNEGKTSYSCNDIWGGLTYNFDGLWNNTNSLFMSLIVGLATPVCMPEIPNKFSWLIDFGRHYPVLQQVQYSPRWGIQKMGDLSVGFYLIPLNFTFMY